MYRASPRGPGRSQRRCQRDGEPLTVLSDDRGGVQPNTIDIGWIRANLDRLDNDDPVWTEVERLPDGTLKATSLVNLSDSSGTVHEDRSTSSKEVLEQPPPRVWARQQQGSGPPCHHPLVSGARAASLFRDLVFSDERCLGILCRM